MIICQIYNEYVSILEVSKLGVYMGLGLLKNLTNLTHAGWVRLGFFYIISSVWVTKSQTRKTWVGYLGMGFRLDYPVHPKIEDILCNLFMFINIYILYIYIYIIIYEYAYGIYNTM